MSTKKTIYFHIGTHKTGTTALQKFFVTNKEVLKAKRIKYDYYHDVEYNQGFLINKEAWKTVSFDCSYNHIISSEDFYHYILTLTDEVKNSLSGFQINFIIYLKRQDLMKESVYNQIVKMSGFCGEIQDDTHYNLDYYDFLLRLKENFPDAKITVRPYEKRQFIGGTIFSDFLNILGLELTNEFSIEKGVVNPSLTRDKLEFTRFINMLNFPISLRQQINHLIMRTAVEGNEVSMFRKQNILSPSEAKDILLKYEKSNRCIAKEFLGRSDEILFYDENAIDLNWQPYYRLSKDVAKDILLKAQNIDKNFLHNLCKYIEESQERTELFVKSANFLMPLLLELSGSQKQFIPYEVNDISILDNFKNLEKYLSKEYESADILREVALAFEASGDLQTANNIMKKALELRPTGPFIQQKVVEYKQILEETNEYTQK